MKSGKPIRMVLIWPCTHHTYAHILLRFTGIMHHFIAHVLDRRAELMSLCMEKKHSLYGRQDKERCSEKNEIHTSFFSLKFYVCHEFMQSHIGTRTVIWSTFSSCNNEIRVMIISYHGQKLMTKQQVMFITLI